MNSTTILNQSFIKVRGKRFHYLWLRDNCLNPKSRNPDTFQRIYDYTENPQPKPLYVELNEEELIIDWDEKPSHRSIYPISWLMKYAYDPDPKQICNKPKLVLWDRFWFDKHPIERHDIHSCPQLVWMDELCALGFTLLSNMSIEEMESFLTKSIGPINATFEIVSDVKPTPDTKDLGDLMTGPEVLPHNAHNYKLSKFLMLFFYCVEHNAKGGESILVDSFRVCEDFRQKYPEYFKILSETPIVFHKFDPQNNYYFSDSAPIIQLDTQGNIYRICFNQKNCERTIPFEKTESFYQAYSIFYNYMKNPAYQYRFRLNDGDCLLIHNVRVMHGRTAFNPRPGIRHLKAGFVDWDYFIARRNFYQSKHLYLSE
ncbi:TauD/TfdA family dioxygenase [Okeania sp. SIO2B3]|uniref:TauD/TfdA family dioxygenase n=1 Tax=Okeania sp. SIO2B3 TaxID=2607784 RepID=UPI0013C11464|nr:TauD/TfdA family dioxygenase [Okeania sp. SIO2B3]NET46160.1 taurine catabolism dioxygenase TauD [Okeania sp. SIO2B3]